MAALDDAIVLLDTIISRLRTRTPLQQPTQQKAATEGPPSTPCEEQPTISSSEGSQTPVYSPDTIDDFDKAWLQVGQVVSVEEHPIAEKLYICKVEIAQGEFKQVVAGLRKFLPSSELLGKKVCLVLNLKAAKLAGQLSEAMILAGEAQIHGSLSVKILEPPAAASVGERIYLEGSAPSAKPVKQLSSKIWEKLLPLLKVQGGFAKFAQQCLVTSAGAVTASDLPDGSSIH